VSNHESTIASKILIYQRLRAGGDGGQGRNRTIDTRIWFETSMTLTWTSRGFWKQRLAQRWLLLARAEQEAGDDPTRALGLSRR
jgi:hypothetical protein